MASVEELDRRLQRMEASDAIRNLKAHYCDLCDEGYDPDALTALFTADGVWDGGQLGVFEGRDAVHRFFTAMPRNMSFAIHHVTNAAVHIAEDCRTASGRWYLLQTATSTRNPRALWLAGRYDDEFVLTDEGWRFSRIAITSRFLTTHEDGWVKTPFTEV